MTERTSVHTARPADATGRDGPVIALRAAALLAVLAILWQGATAGGILMRSRTFLQLHEAGPSPSTCPPG